MSAIEWMDNNNIETVGTKFQIREKVIYSSDKVDLLGLAIDDQLNFESHISEICRKAAGQLNALKRLGSNVPLESRRILADSFILSNFNYCPLVSVVFFNSKTGSKNSGKGSPICS